jgi:hypothetical protein
VGFCLVTERGEKGRMMSKDEMRWNPIASHLTDAQVEAIERIHKRYGGVEWHPRDFWHTFDLPDGWVAGWVKRKDRSNGPERALYIGVSPDGEVHS